MDLEVLEGVYNGPVAFTFLTPSSLLLSERTAITLLDLEASTKKLLIGSAEKGGYLDGPAHDARFTWINDIIAIGKFNM